MSFPAGGFVPWGASSASSGAGILQPPGPAQEAGHRTAQRGASMQVQGWPAKVETIVKEKLGMYLMELEKVRRLCF